MCTHSPEPEGLNPRQSRLRGCWRCPRRCRTPPRPPPAPGSPLGGLRWGKGGLLDSITGGFAHKKGVFSAGGPMDGVAAPYNCLTPVVLVLHHKHATSGVHIFYSHCTSMSTSFPMLSPMVLVARQVYVPASCLMISFCHSILRSLKEICCVLFQCLDTVESSNNRPRPTSSCLKNLGGKKISLILHWILLHCLP